MGQQRTRRWMGPASAAAVMATIAALAPAAAAAGVLYLGLPNGRTVAYVVAAAGAERASVADLPDVGANAFPVLVDLDADGDRDALIGESGGHVRVFENTGRDAAPRWVRRTGWEPAADAGADAAPAAGDLDGDGDFDLLVGTRTDDVRAFENTGSRQAPVWSERPAWAVGGLGNASRPALGDVDGDGRLDLMVGLGSGEVRAYRGGGGASFARRADWDAAVVGDRVAPALGDLDGDGRQELVLTDGLARTTVLRRGGSGWTAAGLAVPDPGSGPGGPAIVPGPTAIGAPASPAVPTATATPAPAPPAPGATATAVPAPPPSGGGEGAPTAALDASPSQGTAPLVVRLDARGSRDPDGDALSFAWDFGDGSSADGGVDDPDAAIKRAKPDYAAAKATRDAKHYEDAVAQYLALVERLVPLTDVTVDGPVKVKGTRRIDRVARWYLQKIAHDLGSIYLYHSLGLASCERYELALQFSRESVRQAELGGFPGLPASNGTLANVDRAADKLADAGCAIPEPEAMFPEALSPAGPVVVHEYATPGRYQARVVVSDGRSVASASVTIVVGADGGDPPPPVPTPVPPPPGDGETPEGFGAHTRGGAGGRVILVREATDAAVRAAFADAAKGNARVVFEVAGPIAITKPLPRLSGAFVTIEGNGATLVGTYGSRSAATVDVRGHDVIVRNLRLRNGGDNLRVQGTDAYNVVVSHVSSTGAADDGISIGYGARDVTVQYAFLAGNTRSIFLKYKNTTNVSIHHTWIMKQWIRGPLVSTGVADLRNLIVEDWAEWGTRFEAGASGNVVNSLFLLGPYAQSIGGKSSSALRLNQQGPVFTAGNMFEGRAQSTDTGSAGAPLDAPPVTTHDTHAMIDVVQARAGCLPRDATDRAYAATETGWSIGESRPYRLDY